MSRNVTNVICTYYGGLQGPALARCASNLGILRGQSSQSLRTVLQALLSPCHVLQILVIVDSDNFS